MSNPAEESTSGEVARMELLDHIRELRRRLIHSVLVVLGCSIVGYSFANQIFRILAKPFFDAFPGESLIGTGPAEAFLIKMKVAIAFGFVAALPFLLFQLWMFVMPGLYPKERRLFIPFLVSSCGLFVGGMYFCYEAVLPLTLQFFQSQYDSIGLKPTIRLSEHLSLLLQTVLGFGIAFELPVIAFLLGRAGILRSENLIGFGRYAIVIIFVVAAVLTPPDVLTQLLMAGPLLLLYGLSILVLRWTEKNEQELDSSAPEEP